MSIARDELASFSQFVWQTDRSDLSLEECLQLWREEQEMSHTLAQVQRSVDDIAAGKVMSLEEADARIRGEFGFAPRSR